ncbi:MAG: UDP-3-O-(3-hydroxymyristoyl)glucosamine N-acyltransferase [Acidobacteria bacterium]|nr:UDP-3-O-(3-hydroxymyristoyl)glucosamine N-acyltransferase [Acidobacteriota bacterium]
MKLGEIARKLNCTLQGPADLEISGVSGIEEASETELTFVSNPQYLPKLKTTRAAAVILSKGDKAPIPALISDNPYLTFAQAVELFYSPPTPIPGIHPTASLALSACVGENASIGANVAIGAGVRLGKNALLYPNVTIYPHAQIGDDFIAHSNSVVREYCQIGNRVILQNGAVIGSDGFGFAPRSDGSFYKIVQSGIVVIEDDVEIGANTCIDRASIGETRIAAGTKLDNLVQIGHGCRIGRHTIIAAQTGVAGSTQVGNQVVLAGQVGIAGHLKIGDRVIVTAQSGVGHSIEDGKKVSGSPEMDSTVWKKNYLLMQQFPELVRTLKQVKKDLDELKQKLESA